MPLHIHASDIKPYRDDIYSIKTIHNNTTAYRINIAPNKTDRIAQTTALNNERTSIMIDAFEEFLF